MWLWASSCLKFCISCFILPLTTSLPMLHFCHCDIISCFSTAPLPVHSFQGIVYFWHQLRMSCLSVSICFSPRWILWAFPSRRHWIESNARHVTFFRKRIAFELWIYSQHVLQPQKNGGKINVEKTSMGMVWSVFYTTSIFSLLKLI